MVLRLIFNNFILKTLFSLCFKFQIWSVTMCLISIYISAFYGLEKEVLLKALKSLEIQRRAQLMNLGAESEGVKFLQ